MATAQKKEKKEEASKAAGTLDLTLTLQFTGHRGRLKTVRKRVE